MKRLRLLTYNVHKAVGTDGRPDVRRIASVVRHYHPDVVALQEVMWYGAATGHRPQPAEFAARIGMRAGAVGLNVTRRVGIYGNMTLAALAVTDAVNVDLTIPLKKARAALYTRVDAGGTALHVFNVHLGLARFERGLQCERLIAEIDELAGPDECVVVTGDSNDWRDRLFPGIFEPAGFTRHASRAGTQVAGTFPSWYPVANLDRVFVRGPVRVRREFASRLALARIASDHLPVVCELEFENDGGATR